MKTTQAWGWLLAGVLAAGLNAVYYDGGVQWTHRAADSLADRSAAVLNRANEGADRFLAKTELVSARTETASCSLATAVARLQNQIAQITTAHSEAEVNRIEAMSARESAREQAQMARLEASRARMEARIEARAARIGVATVAFHPIRMSPVVCPRVRVNVPRPPMIRIPAPVVHIEMPGVGPV